jgi:Rod binding domain-containing protein
MSDPLLAVDLANPARRAADSPAAPATLRQRQAMQAAKDFESLLVHELLKEMRQTIPSSSDQEAAGEQIQGMFWSFLSQEIANRGGLGLWKSLYRQMEQSLAQPPAASRVEQSL